MKLEPKDISEQLRGVVGDRVANLYDALVVAANSYDPNSEDAEIKLLTLSHYAREFMNSFPETIMGNKVDWPSKTGQESTVVSNLKTLLAENPYTFPVDNQNLDVTPIPSVLAKALSQLSAASIAGSLNARQKASYAVLGYVDITNASVNPWLHAHDFFMGFAHFRRGEVGSLPSQQEVLHYLKLIDNALLIRLDNFFSAKQDLTATLDAANKKTSTGGYIKPSKAEVENALSLLGDQNLRSVFYNNLSNPNWLGRLCELGVFDNLPGLDEDGKYYLLWPESAYLRSIASTSPDDVAELLAQCAKSKNPHVRTSIIQISCELPDGSLGEVARQISQWAKDEFRMESYFWSIDEIDILLARLVQSEDKALYNIGNKLAHTLFRPRISKNSGNYFKEIIALVDTYTYADRLAHLCVSLGSEKALQFCSRQLMVLTKLEEDNHGGRSYIWLPSVESACQQKRETIESALVSQQVALLADAIKAGRNVAPLLFNEKAPIVARCAMYALMAVSNTALDSQDGVDIGAYAGSVKKLLLSGIILEREHDAEYYPLVNVALKSGFITPNEYMAHVKEERLLRKKQILGLFTNCDSDKNKEAAEVQAKEEADRWTHRALSLVDRELLGINDQELASELDSKFGQQEYMAAHIGEAVTITGPNTPKTKDDMLVMTPDALLAWLRLWQPTTNDKYNLVTHSGQGRALAALIVEAPFFFMGFELAESKLRPTYLRSIIDGWHSALENGKEIPLEDFLKLISYISWQDDRQVIEEGADAFDDDPSYAFAKKSVVRALDELLKSDMPLGAVTMNSILACLKNLLDSTRNTADIEDSHESAPSTAALNLLEPMVITCLEAWTYKAKNPTPAQGILEDYLQGGKRTLINTAALSNGFGYLVVKGSDWIVERYTLLFGDSASASEEQAFMLTSILALYRPYRPMHDLLKTAMLNALSSGASDYKLSDHWGPGSNSCMELIGNWLYMNYLCGFSRNNDSLLTMWRNRAAPEQLGQCLNYVCRALINSPKLDSKIKNRLKKLWDYHANVLLPSRGSAALNGISALIRSDTFEPSWWGPRAIKQLTEGDTNSAFLVTKEDVLALSSYDADMAVELLIAMLNREYKIHFYSYDEIAVPVLESAMSANGGKLNETAENCMNLLGKVAGLVNLDEELGLA